MALKYIKATALSFIASVALFNQASAQQIFKISQFTQHNFLYNPAAAGAAENSSVGVAYRSQWSGIDGGPKTVFAYGDHFISGKSIGIAPVIYSDKTGPTSRTGGQVNVSYAMKLNDRSRLHLGLGADILQYKIDMNKIGEYIPNDPLLASSGTTTKADASFGVYYTSPKLSGGIGIQNLIQSKLGFVKTDAKVTDGKLYRHYFAMANYKIQMDEVNTLTPTMLIKYMPNAPTEYEVGARFEHDNLISFGANWCYRQMVNFQVGVKVAKKFQIGYCYEVYNSPINVFSTGGNAHEVLLRYNFIK
ncbi:PorP/SprF family type IX secretion system membrane protein [Polluticaenibacter yanchengensis]|uniref:Type IX secretion system membrane protein PorP/SprF n=1 Tax=Polluticaenibacter yanchengensis TaxID=3014562 RepID=A0ABT4UGD9_9BACT|nr:type IX secretion system membrane protein PorP/SprF [Chitinophagaceae bacterium LY-5]